MANEIKVAIEQVSAFTSKASIRNHSLLVDRPVSKGGADLGPMGGELFLASIGGCFMSNLLAAIHARQSSLSNVRTEVTGTLTESPARFTAVQLSITADGADQSSLSHLAEIADRSCIMMNTLRRSLELSVTVIATSI
jgi:putative redox protein